MNIYNSVSMRKFKIAAVSYFVKRLHVYGSVRINRQIVIATICCKTYNRLTLINIKMFWMGILKQSVTYLQLIWEHLFFSITKWKCTVNWTDTCIIIFHKTLLHSEGEVKWQIDEKSSCDNIIKFKCIVSFLKESSCKQYRLV